MSRPPTFSPPPGARAHRLRTSRGEFAVIEAGTPVKGTVLLVPGFTGSKEDFIALHEPLAEAGYRSVAVDGRGQYESEGPKDDESPYAQDELARDLLAQAQVVGDGAPLHLLGHSLGGQISRAAVLLDPSPFASLTLMASGPAQISQSQQQRVKLLRDALAVMGMQQVWDAIQAMEPPEETDTGGLDEGLDDSADLRRRWLAHSPAQLIATGRQLCAEPDRVAELAALGLPTHVLSGERDDTWPIPLLDDMAARLRAHRTVIAAAEHSPNTDQPKATASALIGFWDRLTG
ncbi:alpha/beta hydrolase [Streptomyces sp. JV178]|uniref:alpha/beta fold hydrolase n=1 Tax=unclassified Streptomyces TaxID=2593676 RepID=UPI000C1B5CD9|nr:alpha/beta hydrolase [Streptomyces sp. JV178]PIM70122.1 alpha/beta hydrolase [Streptomyces sp. JV178]